MSTYEQWQDGSITDTEALRLLCDDLSEIEDVYKRAEDTRRAKRLQVEEIVQRLGGKAEVIGYGTLAITGPSRRINFDSKRLDSLIAELLQDGDMYTAGKIAECRSETASHGSLRVTRDRAK